MLLSLDVSGDGAEFRDRPGKAGRMTALRVAGADLPALADQLDRRLGLAGGGLTSGGLASSGPAGGGSIEERITEAVREMARRGYIRETYHSNLHFVEDACVHSGVGYAERWFDGQRWQAARRRMPVFRSVEANGFLRTLTALTHELRDPSFELIEEFTDPAVAYPEDLHTRYGSRLSVSMAELGRIAGPFARGEHPEGLAVAVVDALVARGELTPQLAPGGCVERFAGWCAQAGVRPRRDGRERRHRLARAGDLVLEVGFDTRTWFEPRVTFTEAYRPGGDWYGGTQYEVSAPLDAVPRLVEQWGGRLGPVDVPGRDDDRLIGCFEALVARGELSTALPRQRNREVVAEWMAAAGVEPRRRGFSRTEPLLRVSRASTDSSYALSLFLDPGPRGGIVFTERYEYYPRPGDAGREYSYSVSTPYSSLPALVEHLEQAPGQGGPEDRLVACFRARTAAGELHAGMGLREARDLVQRWFAGAGVPARADGSSWINSD
ncbi:hypothetical protein [Actinoplanes sp. RD1]|uniref:hypothetical protein n=1 Tax=Actinoplanes sp. RD1 TaxID=3064538 RepID=UPI002740CA92|nr:hypothetical protein [Actinoplanes sp. RD1]